MIKEIKRSLRRSFISRRKQLQAEIKQSADDKIFLAFIASEEFKECENLLCYVSTEIEVDTVKIIRHSLSIGKNVFVPKCAEQGNLMAFHRISSLDDLAEGMYDILEPDESQPVYDSSYMNAVCVVPALSFNTAGMRLGYGKGYYDRFIFENPNVIPIGLCYDNFISEDIPAEEHDKAVKKIITDKRIIKTEV